MLRDEGAAGTWIELELVSVRVEFGIDEEQLAPVMDNNVKEKLSK